MSRALYPSLSAELRDATGIDVGYDRSGVLAAALDDAGERELVERRAWQQRRSLNVGWLSGDEVRAREPALGPAIRAALEFPDDAQVNARELARAFSQAAAAAGARFLTGRYVRRVVIERGEATGLELDGETLPAGTVVVAAGSWSGLVEGGGVPSTVVRPARGQLVSIETRPPLFRHVVSVRGGYLVPRRDGTVLAGSTVEMAGFRKQVTVGGLAGILTLARTLVPALADAPVTGDLVELPPLHGGSPAGAGRDAGARPRARDRPLPQRHPAGADHRRGDRRAGRDRAFGDRSRAVLGHALRAVAGPLSLTLSPLRGARGPSESRTLSRLRERAGVRASRLRSLPTSLSATSAVVTVPAPKRSAMASRARFSACAVVGGGANRPSCGASAATRFWADTPVRRVGRAGSRASSAAASGTAPGRRRSPRPASRAG